MATVIEREDDAIVTRAGQRLGGKSTFKRPLRNRLDAHEVIEKGFPGGALIFLSENVALLQQPGAFEKAMGISLRTLQRRKREDSPKRLSLEQSGRAWKFAELLEEAIEVFGNQEDAEAFFNRPALGLNQRLPIDLLSTPAGTELVETHLERLKYGVYA
ncbi:MAG TPA: antitoxin [Gammaproteobacteria bacterium]|nr:antitoxin [Gammaproteobacteria bacterium]|tara:strand:+ start:70 stop:546 length:477 start_codon:yes stop_codon:yes gene_type:complete